MGPSRGLKLDGDLLAYSSPAICPFTGLFLVAIYIEGDAAAIIARPSYDAQSADATLQVTGFYSVGDGLYQRFDVRTVQHVFTEAEVNGAISDAGLEPFEVLAPFTDEPPGSRVQRLLYACRRARAGSVEVVRNS